MDKYFPSGKKIILKDFCKQLTEQRDIYTVQRYENNEVRFCQLKTIKSWLGLNRFTVI